MWDDEAMKSKSDQVQLMQAAKLQKLMNKPIRSNGVVTTWGLLLAGRIAEGWVPVCEEREIRKEVINRKWGQPDHTISRVTEYFLKSPEASPYFWPLPKMLHDFARRCWGMEA